MARSNYPQSTPRTLTTSSMVSTSSSSSSTPLTPPSQAGSPSYFSPVSPASTTSSASPTSPTERSFFGAIAQSITSRSRSRSRDRSHRSRSRSPIPPTTSATTIAPTRPSPYGRPVSSTPATGSSARDSGTQRKSVHSRQASYGSSISSPTGTMPVAQCGRHSNDWLFGGFSVTDTVKNLMERRDT
ncbi:MAG: hypothetical protein M1820_008037 [Bogoriella megaspora]|nr:MAG: hypothetical protein M1820_008037 [Bogoriella megaspora]